MRFEKRKYRLTGITKLLGSQPANPAVRTAYVASKAPNQDKADDETDHLPEDLDSLNLSVFLRNKGSLCISDYVIKGFLKEAGKVMKGQIGIAQPASKVDNFVLIEPMYLTLWRGGEEIDVADGDFERPLRAQTMQGERVTVVASEYVLPPWQVEFEITLLENEKTARSVALDFEAIESMLDYGQIKGLGQWRNGQNGRFTWERIDEHE